MTGKMHWGTGGYWVLGTGYWVLGTGYWVLGTGYWVLGTGYWVLGTGYWVLGTGYWVLGTGYWVPTPDFEKISTTEHVGLSDVPTFCENKATNHRESSGKNQLFSLRKCPKENHYTLEGPKKYPIYT